MTRADILIVDDLPANVRLLRELLSSEGFRIRVATNGARCLSAVSKLLPDLILLDIMMPEMDGFEVCEELKRGPARDVPVIFISALDETFDKVRAFSAGGVDFVTKPFQEAEVLARVRTHLALRRAQQALEEHNRELALLNTMGHALHRSTTESETYEVIADACAQIFSDASGALLMAPAARGSLELVAHWGDAPEEQWRQQAEAAADIDLDAAEEGFVAAEGTLHLPIRSEGRVLGALSLRPDGPEPDAQLGLLRSRQRVAIEIAAHCAHAVVRARLHETLRREALYDPLTGLYNRRHMEASLGREEHLARRQGSSLGLIMADIDHFKVFNDTHGHEAGDAVLRELGGILKGVVRGSDIACRYGGEEFLIICPDTSPDAMEDVAERLMRRVRELTIVHRGAELHVTMSVGVAACPASGATAKDALARADAALYRAKAEGRDRAVFASKESRLASPPD